MPEIPDAHQSLHWLNRFSVNTGAALKNSPCIWGEAMTTATRTSHDPFALEVAAVMERVLRPKDMLLFGSRARGDWDRGSDIDVMAIFEDAAEGRERYRAALNAGRERARELYGETVTVELVLYSEERFHRLRQARSHVAYSAAMEGISMGRKGGELCGSGYPEPEQPDGWPDVEQRFLNAQRCLDDGAGMLEAGLSREAVGWQLQRAMENGLKGFLAWVEYDDGKGSTREGWLRTHNLEELQTAARRYEAGQKILGDAEFSSLTDYAVKVQYAGEEIPLDETQVYRAVAGTVAHFIKQVEKESGLGLPVYQRGEPRTGTV